jgi:hypothetical protein
VTPRAHLKSKALFLQQAPYKVPVPYPSGYYGPPHPPYMWGPQPAMMAPYGAPGAYYPGYPPPPMPGTAPAYYTTTPPKVFPETASPDRNVLLMLYGCSRRCTWGGIGETESMHWRASVPGCRHAPCPGAHSRAIASCCISPGIGRMNLLHSEHCWVRIAF